MLRLSMILVLAACGSGGSGGSKQPPSPPPPAPDAAPLRGGGADTVSMIAPLWPDGCFTTHDGTRVVASDAARCAQPRRPHSTFKPPNALVGLDAGILTGAESAMTWDKKKIATSPYWSEAMKRPQTLRTGMAVSAVPYFRTLALQIGEARMRDGLKRLDYGNQDISGGLDAFWLTGGGLRISADQQLAFMTKLATASIAGFKPEHQKVVRKVMQLDERGGAILFGKTGTGFVEDREGVYLGWLVGWVERDGKTFPFASWMEITGDIDAVRAAREERVRATLDALGWIPKKPPG